MLPSATFGGASQPLSFLLALSRREFQEVDLGMLGEMFGTAADDKLFVPTLLDGNSKDAHRLESCRGEVSPRVRRGDHIAVVDG
jgi:hypothetical protein